jgi:hypothetical protein
MATYIKTLSFSTRGWSKQGFNSEKDDPKVNSALQQLQSQGAKIMDVKVALGGSFWTTIFTGVIAVYLITYEASNPIA